MGKEIERKYLLPKFPTELIDSGALKMISVEKMEQTYLAFGNIEDRVRKIVNITNPDEPFISFTRTQKRSIEDDLIRQEEEWEINHDEYQQLTHKRNKKPLIKTRTTVLDVVDGRLIEIDEYPSFQLTVAEVEFTSIEEALSFVPPIWFGEEVSKELKRKYGNPALWESVQELSE
jgi:adenylate cyclase